MSRVRVGGAMEMGMCGGRVVCVRGGAGAGAETRGGEGSKRLWAPCGGRPSPLRDRTDVCPHTFSIKFFFFLSNFFFSFWFVLSLSTTHIEARVLLLFQQYLDAITRAWGDWALFQQLLAVLRKIGDRHGGATIANVAVRWVLDHSFVGAVLVGAST